jgi:catechol 2,3-dioxygenase-like lactoylglutathione lyase family enzyme
MATVQVRYIVHDVDAAIAFYCNLLGFREVMHPAPSLVEDPSGNPVELFEPTTAEARLNTN